MVNKYLAGGILGFILGGLVVSIAYTIDNNATTPKDTTPQASMTENMMTNSNNLKDLKGDEFDKAFLADMIVHHQGAIQMAKLAQTNSNRAEIKQMGTDIINAQSAEIEMMQNWQMDWGFMSPAGSHDMGNM